MAERLFTDLLPRVQPHVIACPAETVRQYIRNAAIRVCEWSVAWRYEVRQFNLVAGVHHYAYNKPTNADVHAVFGVVINETHPLTPLTLEQAINRYPAWADMLGGVDPLSAWSLTAPSQFNTDEFNALTFGGNPAFVTPEDALEGAGQPACITQLGPDRFVVLPTPDQTYPLRMFLALKPRRTATSMDEVPFNELEDAIFHRTLQDLMSIPKNPWTDLELAAYHARQYKYLANEARARAELTNMRADVRVQYQPFD